MFPVFEDEAGPSKSRTGINAEVAERRTAQRAKAATERVALDSASPQSSPAPSPFAFGKSSGSPSITNNISGFGRATIDDEKRNTQAGLVGIKSSNGQTIGSTTSIIADQGALNVKFWTCSSNCDTLNPANRNKCGKYWGRLFVPSIDSTTDHLSTAKCNRPRVQDVPPSSSQRDAIVIDD